MVVVMNTIRREAVPWARLSRIWRESCRSGSIWRRLFFSSRRRHAGRVRHRSQASARDEFEVFPTGSRPAWCDGSLWFGASLGPPARGASHEVKTDPAGACKVIRTAQQDGCGRRGGYLRGGDAPPPAVRRFAFDRQPGGGDASSGSRATRRSAHGAAQCTARASEQDRLVAAQSAQHAYRLKRMLADGAD
jgi:hypothetical protein